MRNCCYFHLLLRGEFLSTVHATFQNFRISPLIKEHYKQCNSYTLKLTCTANLSKFLLVTLVNSSNFVTYQYKFFQCNIDCFVELYKELQPSNNQAKKVAATLLLKSREIFRFTKQPVLLFLTVRILTENKKQKSCRKTDFWSKFKICLNVK